MTNQDVTMLTTFPIKFKLFHSKISYYRKFPSVPALNFVCRLSQWTSHNTHSYLTLLHSRETKDLQDNCMSQEDCEELNCETVIPPMAEPKINLHFSETSLWEERAPNSPASNEVLPNRVSISNWGLQTHCWVGFFHFLPLLLWLTVAVGSVHTAQSTAPALEQAQPEKQCQHTPCQAARSAELLPCHNWMAQGSLPSKGHGLSFSFPKSRQKA